MKYMITTFAAVLFVVVLVLTVLFWLQAEKPTRGICAHRGASDSHPENTIAAFREAIRLGAHMIELDVALPVMGSWC